MYMPNPNGYIWAQGLWEGIRIIMGVDPKWGFKQRRYVWAQSLR